MTRMQHVADPVNPALESAWAGWPDWADESTIELGPCPSDEDSAWWAEHAPGNAGDYDVEDLAVEDDPAYLAWLDARAAESARLDRLEGLIPVDVAEGIARTSLVGLADECADAYSDEAERVSGRRPSRDEAGRALDVAWFRHGCRY